MKKNLLFIPFTFLFFISVNAQQSDSFNELKNELLGPRNMIGFNLDIYGPTGKFATLLEGSSASGFGLNYLRRTNPRWSFGGELSVAMYYKAEYDLQTQSGTSVPVYEEDCFWTIRGLARYDLVRTEFFTTYTEFRIGMNNFFSDVSATVDVNEDIGKTVSHGHSLVAGVGLGADIGLGNFSESNNGISRTYITVRGGYNYGSPTYFRSANVPSGQTNDFEKYRHYSEISYFDFNIGMGLKF